MDFIFGVVVGALGGLGIGLYYGQMLAETNSYVRGVKDGRSQREEFVIPYDKMV